MSVRRIAALSVAVFSLTVVGTACGNGGGGGSSYKEPKGRAQTTLDIKGGNFFFDPENAEAPAGIDTIKMDSESGLHTLVFDDGKLPGFKLEASSGESDQLKANLRPGRYTIYCDVPGHREAGMEGTITVT
jgi:plastocyanin